MLSLAWLMGPFLPECVADAPAVATTNLTGTLIFTNTFSDLNYDRRVVPGTGLTANQSRFYRALWMP